DGGDDGERPDACGAVLGNGGLERSGVEPEPFVRGDAAYAGEAEAERDRGLVHAGVGLLGAVDPEPRQVWASGEPVLADAELGMRFPCSGEGVERAAGGGVVDHAEPALGQAEELA